MDAAVNALTSKAEIGFADLYADLKAALPGAGEPWVEDIRSEAFRTFQAAGLPHRRVEEWKYTDLRARLDGAFAPVSAPELLDRKRVLGALAPGLAELDCHLLVIVDGHLVPDLSDLDFIGENGELIALGQALAVPPDWLRKGLAERGGSDDTTILNLNTALMRDGIGLRIEAGAAIEKPVHIVQLHCASSPASAVTRNVLAMGEGARASLIESFVSVSDAPYQRIAASDVVLAEGAQLHHLMIQMEGAEATHLSNWTAALGAKSNYNAFQFVEGSGLARSEIHLRFDGEHAEASVNGVFLGRGKQHLDTTLFVDHAVANCQSRMLFKGALDDAARGVFQGKIMVRQPAQKTDSKEMAQGLLLSERAEFDSKPELEIFADDVICGHGSTSGQIDEELLFYLRARGIGELEARSLLIQAFAGEAVELVENETVRDALNGAVRSWLGRRDA